MPRRPDMPCTQCGKLLWRGKTSAAKPVCRPCRGQAPKPHGLMQYKKRGCRCEVCRAANAAASNRYYHEYRAKHGVSPYDKYNVGQRKRFSVAIQRQVYQRDGGVCQLCMEPVPADVDRWHPLAATLDHIECQSWALIPDHRLTNLRLAHRRCNTIRNNRAA